MSLALWNKLPPGLFEKSYFEWSKLDQPVRELTARLSISQKFKCALCPADQCLIIEHEHKPGEKPPFTIYNVRGLVCRSCNQQISIFERLEQGQYCGSEISHSRLSSHAYESYKYVFECRVEALHEIELEKRLGTGNYWHRRRVLDELDEWLEGGRPPFWRRSREENKAGD